MTNPTAPDVPAGGTDLDGVILQPGQHVNHPREGPGENYGQPSQYAGPVVPEQVPVVNPGGGLDTMNTSTADPDPLNPQGPTPQAVYGKAPGSTSGTYVP